MREKNTVAVAVAREPVVGPAQVRRLDVQLAAVLLEDVDAAVVADRVGDPRADDVRGGADRDDREQRVVAARDVEAGEQQRRLGRDRDAGALGHHEHEDPRRGRGVDDVDRELDQRVGDGGEDEHGRAAQGRRRLPVGSMRGSVSEVMRCFARGCGPPDVGLRPQHLEDHDRLVDARGLRGPVRDLVAPRAARPRRRGAPATISSPLRERSSRAASPAPRAPRRRRSTASAMSTISQRTPPASAASIRRASSASVAASSVPRTSSWWTTSSSRCSRTASAPGWTTARSDWDVNIADPGVPGRVQSMAVLGFSREWPSPCSTRSTPLAPLRDALARQGRRGARRGPLHPRPGGRGASSASSPPTSGHAARGRRRQRHRRARARAARDGRRAGRRRRRAVVHVLRVGRGDRGDRREPGVLRHRPGDVLRHAGHRARRADAADARS